MTEAEATEQAPFSDPSVRENDVLLGRGGGTNNHVGNKRFRTFVQDNQSEYLKARKKDKVVIARRIVALVHQNNGRFLKQGNSREWEEVDVKKATAKTSQALREGLDVRNQAIRPPKMPRRDSDASYPTPARKRVKTSQQSPLSPAAPSMVSVEENMLKTEVYPIPSQMPLIHYQPQLSKSDVTDECAV